LGTKNGTFSAKNPVKSRGMKKIAKNVVQNISEFGFKRLDNFGVRGTMNLWRCTGDVY